ncbi:hypothetical protein H1R20_g2457, partial [Candolleomyces eurysporus]
MSPETRRDTVEPPIERLGSYEVLDSSSFWGAKAIVLRGYKGEPTSPSRTTHSRSPSLEIVGERAAPAQTQTHRTVAIPLYLGRLQTILVQQHFEAMCLLLQQELEDMNFSAFRIHDHQVLDRVYVALWDVLRAQSLVEVYTASPALPTDLQAHLLVLLSAIKFLLCNNP